MGRNIRLLIINDERHLRESLAMMFYEAFEAEMDLAADGETASTLLTENRYDLIISDNRLPGILGTELLQSVRAGQYFDSLRLLGTPPRTPFILATGEVEFEVEELVIDLGGYFFETPVHIGILMALIRASLR